MVLDDSGGRIEAIIPKYRCHHCLESIGQQRAFIPTVALDFTFSKLQIAAQVDTSRDFGQLGFVDHIGPNARKIALTHLRIGLHQQITDNQVEHRIAQKLQPFVIAHIGAGLFIDKRAVAQCFFQQIQVAESVWEGLL